MKSVSALNKIEKAVSGVESELVLHAAGKGNISNPNQLSRMKEQLLAMKREVEGANVSGSLIGIGRVVADSWPFNSELGEALIDAEDAYKRFSPNRPTS